MEAPGGNLDSYRAPVSGNSSSRRYGMLSASNFIQAPLSALLEYSGLLRGRSGHQEAESLIGGRSAAAFREQHHAQTEQASNDGEVSIRIIDAGEQENDREGGGLVVGQLRESGLLQNDVSGQHIARVGSVSLVSEEGQVDGRTDIGSGEGISQSVNGVADGEAGDGAGANGRDSSYQRYDIQQAARWIEQVLPFSLLLLVVFIRQHLQGFFVTIWIAAVMFKSNDILKKQTALKGERKISVLAGISIAFSVHVIGVYWWYQNDDLLYPLVMLPPKVIPPFWHAIFIIMVNDTLVRQAAMVIKFILLMYYKNSRGRNYRKQGQMLTLVEYLLLLYRALLPTPVWYRFFLNKEYGSLFSSLMTGLYLTFKLTSVVEKVQSFFAALKVLSRKEVHYGAYATSEQVVAAGDLCAICQEKMHAPILLRCKHIFCEDCVSEWFERERTCPLCRALVKPADLRSFGDGSTSLFFQLSEGHNKRLTTPSSNSLSLRKLSFFILIIFIKMAKGGKLLKLKSVLKKWNSFSKSNRHSICSIASADDDVSYSSSNDVVSSGDLQAVYVGKSRRRYLVGPDVVHHPLFKELAERSDDDDSINVACEVVLFEHLLWMLENADPQPESMNELVEFYAC